MTKGASASTSFLICRCDSRLCALPLAHVIETMRPLPVETFPGMPVYLLGLSIIRGATVPVVSLSALVNAASAPQPARYVTLKAGERTVCLAVQDVVGVRQLGSTATLDIPPLLRNINADIVTAIGTLDAELVLVLQASHLLSEAAWQAMEREAVQA
jgi:purine-binding chemotaxis protein CheW